jgi:hypothetical protein
MLTMGINSFGAVWIEGALFGKDESGVMSEAKMYGFNVKEKAIKGEKSFLKYINRHILIFDILSLL